MSGIGIDVDQLLRAYGWRYIEYVLALDEDGDRDTESLFRSLTPKRREVAEVLTEQIKDMPSTAFPYHLRTEASRPITDSGMSFSRHLRSYCLGGEEVFMATREADEVLHSLIKILFEIWPALLIPLDDPELPHGLISGVLPVHSYAGECCRAILGDEDFTRLFPGVKATDGGDSFTLYRSGAYWITAAGRGSTIQVGTLIGMLIDNAVALASSSSEKLTFDLLVEKLRQTIGVMRTFARGDVVRVPAIVAVAGPGLPDGARISLGEQCLRPVNPGEAALFGGAGVRITSTFESYYFIQLLKAMPLSEVPDDSDFDKMWNRYMARIGHEYVALVSRFDRLRLALLLTLGVDNAPTLSVGMHIFDPSSVGGQHYKRTDDVYSSDLILTKKQLAELEAMHELVATRHPTSLDIAVKRILRASSERLDPIDAFIDAVIVWENAFGTVSETTFRVTGAIAQLLARGPIEDRLAFQKELKMMYDRRSKLVHGAREPKPTEQEYLRKRSIEVGIGLLQSLYTSRPDLLPLSSEERSNRLLLEA